jgi:hypothetical protein
VQQTYRTLFIRDDRGKVTLTEDAMAFPEEDPHAGLIQVIGEDDRDWIFAGVEVDGKWKFVTPTPAEDIVTLSK